MGLIGNIWVKLGLNTKDLDKGINQAENKLGGMGNSFKKLGGIIAAAFSIKKLVQFGKECFNVAARAEGIRNAFNKLNDARLLNDLRKATRGTVDDVTLMAKAVQAKNFKIPLDQLGKYLAFAKERADSTGESVDYLVNSIVLGIGRKSPLILDNLGINVLEVREEFKKTGDMAVAVGNIIDREMDKDGKSVDTTKTKVEQLGAAWANLKETIGQRLTGSGGGITKDLNKVVNWLSDLVKYGDNEDFTAIFSGGVLGIFGASKHVSAKKRRAQDYDKAIAQIVKNFPVGLSADVSSEDIYAIVSNVFNIKSLERLGERLGKTIDQVKEDVVTSVRTSLQEQVKGGTSANQTVGLLESLEQQIEELELLQSKETDAGKVKEYTRQIAALEEQLDSLTKIKKEENKAREGSIKYIQEQKKLAEDKYLNAVTDAQRKLMHEKVKYWEASERLVKYGKIEPVLQISAGASTPLAGSIKPVSINDIAKEAGSEASKLSENVFMATEERMKSFTEDAKMMTIDLGGSITELASTGIQALMDWAIAGEELDFSAIISQFGKMAMQLGEIIMSAGLAGVALKALFANPWTAVAAGAALIAVGAAATAAGKKVVSGDSSGGSMTSYIGGSGFSGGVPAFATSSPTINVEVSGRLSGQDIYLSGKNYESNKKR